MEHYDNVPEFSLLIEAGGERGERFTFQQPEVTLGRTADNDLVLYDGAVSRRHLVVYYRNQQFIIEDLGSSNGTILNGYPLTQPNVLSEGDRIDVGPVRFVFTLDFEAGDSTQMEVEAIPEHWVNPDPSAPIARPRIDPNSGLPVPPQGDTRAFSAHQLQQGQAPPPPVNATQHLPAHLGHAPSMPGVAPPQRPPFPGQAPPQQPPGPMWSSQPSGFAPAPQPSGFAPAPQPSGFAPAPQYAPAPSQPSGFAPAPGQMSGFSQAPGQMSGFAPVPGQVSGFSQAPAFPGASPVPPPGQMSGFAQAPPLHPTQPPSPPQNRAMIARPGLSLQQERSYVRKLSYLSILLFLGALAFFVIPTPKQTTAIISTPTGTIKGEPVEVNATNAETIYQRSFGYNQYNKLDQRYLFETTFLLPKYQDGKLFVSFRLIGPDSIDIVINDIQSRRLQPSPTQWLPYRVELPRGYLRAYSKNLITFKRVSAAENRWGLTHVRFEEEEVPRTNMRRARNSCTKGDKLYEVLRSKAEHTPRALELYRVCQLYLLRATPPPALLRHANKQIARIEKYRDELYRNGLKDAKENPIAKKEIYQRLLKYFPNEKSPQYQRLQELLQANP
ncbi:MAG: FHA domain-containing protein [Myxococcales bacterium]|nr:FHA domain-containing protein [Myxococcales bacterium]